MLAYRCIIDGEFMRETAPFLLEQLLERRMIYRLEHSVVFDHTVTDAEDNPVLDGWCKDFLQQRYLPSIETTGQHSDLLDSDDALSTRLRDLQRRDPWRSPSSMATCTSHQTEGWTAEGHATTLISQLKVRRCRKINCHSEFCPEGMALGLEQHERVRQHIHRSSAKALLYQVCTPFASELIDHHCRPGKAPVLTAVDSSEDNPWAPPAVEDAVPSGLGDGLRNFADGLAVLGRILVERCCAAHGTKLDYDASRFKEESDTALQYLLKRTEYLKDDGASSAEEEQEENSEQVAERRPTADEPTMPVSASDGEPPSEQTMYQDADPEAERSTPNLLDDATQQALLLEAAISSAAPWELPRGSHPNGADVSGAGGQPPQQEVVEEEDHPALRSQTAMEAAAYGYLEHHLPGFGAANWRSEHRETFFGTPDFTLDDATASRRRGFAFEYEDRQGLLSSDGAPRRLLIGVKGSAAQPFELTAAEHATMQRYTAAANGGSGGGGGGSGGGGGLLGFGLELMPTEFVLLHLEAGPADVSELAAQVRVSHAVHDPAAQLGRGLTAAPATFEARWTSTSTSGGSSGGGESGGGGGGNTA